MQRYPLIDVLRAFAALIVVWYHVIELSAWHSFPHHGLALGPRTGWLGVDLFLVISGFVIGKTAMESAQRGGQWRLRFAERRLRRIVPLYMATLVLFLWLVSPELLLHGLASFWHVVSHLLFVHNLLPSTHGSINGANWSVALEMQFYVLVALSAPWLVRARLWQVLMVWIGVSWAWRWGTTLWWPFGQVTPHVQHVFSTQLPGTLDEFVMGIALARLAMDGRLDYTPQRLLAWAAAAVLLLVPSWLVFREYAYYWNNPAMVTFWRTPMAAGFAALLAVFVLMPRSGGWLTAPLRYLGEISYGIYLWHLPVLLSLISGTSWRGWDLLLATLVGTIGLAALSWHGFEQRWMQGATLRSASAPQPPAVPARTLEGAS